MLIYPYFRCCDNYSQVVGILTNQLFKTNPNSVLDKRYEQMRLLADCPSTSTKWGPCAQFNIVPGSKDVLLEIPPQRFHGLSSSQQVDNLGHDLPYWIEVPNEKGRIMLVSQDPLRTGQKAGYITLSSPFGMHSIDYRGNRVMTQMIELLLKSGYSVYLTDYNKLYGTCQNKKVDFNGMKHQFANILNDEICFWNPSQIIAVGKVAKQALDNSMQVIVNKKLIPVSCIPHPNARFSKCKKFCELKMAVNIPTLPCP